MATAHDLAELLIGGALKIAQKVDSIPTGVNPGYRAGLGGTVLPNGKLLYAGDTASGGAAYAMRFLLDNFGSGQTFPSGVQTVINFDTPVFSERNGGSNPITLGSGWLFTSDVNASYDVTAMVNVDLSVVTVTGPMHLKLRNDGSYNSGAQNFTDPSGSTTSGLLDAIDAGYAKPLLSGSDIVELQAGESLWCELYTSDVITIKSGYIAIHRIGTF